MNASTLTAAVVAGSTVLFASTAARAESGWMSGKWEFWNKNGNYCPTSRNCTGANYVQSEYDVRLPLKNADVFIWNEVKGNIGTGATNSSGNWTIQWSYSGTLSASDKAKTRVWIRPWQKDGRFKVNNTAGQYPNNWSDFGTLVAGTAESSPQAWGTWYIGSSASPTGYYNVYWAAEMAWRTRLATAGWFVSYFTNKEIRGFADDIPSFFGNCPTSCANGVGVQLDANAALRPQHRIIHELGHTSIQVSQAWTPATLGSNNCYMKDGVNGWNFQNNEWACSGFEEGFATLLADTTLYQPNAVAPHSCLSSGACATNSFNIETSTASGSCSTNEASWPLTHIRYLWDVYDSVNDGETISEGTANWWRLYRTYQHYPSGTGNHAADEHWNSTYTALDSTDGRGSRDYEWNYDNSYSLDTTTARSNNCNPL